MAKFIGYTVLIILSSLLRGYVIQVNWEWFIVPFGIIGLSIPHALGLSGLISLLTFKAPKLEDNEENFEKSIAVALYFSVLINLITLLMGWLSHIWMLSL